MTTTRKTKATTKATSTVPATSASTGTPRTRTGLRSKAKEAATHETETLSLEPAEHEEEVEATPARGGAQKGDILPRTEKLERDLKEALNRLSLALSDSRVALSKAEHSFDKTEEMVSSIEKLNDIIETLQTLHDENVDGIDGLESKLDEFGSRFEEMSHSIEEKLRSLREEDVAAMQQTIAAIEESREALRTSLEEMKTRYEEDTARLGQAHEELVIQTRQLGVEVRGELLDEVAKTSQGIRDEIGTLLEQYRKNSTDIVNIQEKLFEALDALGRSEEKIVSLEQRSAEKLSEVEQKFAEVAEEKKHIVHLIDINRQDIVKLKDDVKRDFIDQLTTTSAQMQQEYHGALELFHTETAQIQHTLADLIEGSQKKVDENFDVLMGDLSQIDEKVSQLQTEYDQKIEATRQQMQRELEELGRNHGERMEQAEKSLSNHVEELRKGYTEKIEETTTRLREQFGVMEESSQKLKEQSDGLGSLLKELTGKEEDDALRILELQEDKDAILRSLESLGARIGEVDDKSEEIKASLQEELEKTRLAWEKVEAALEDAQGALERTRDAHGRIDELNERIEETRVNLEGLMGQMRENTYMSDANLDRAKMAMRIMDEIEEKSRKILIPLDDMLHSIEEFETLPEGTDLGFELNDLLQVMIKHAATDLHLKVGAPPTVRLDSELIPVGNQILTDRDCRRLILSAMTRAQRRKLMERSEVDFIYSLGAIRFRINAFLQKGSVSGAFKMLRTEIPTFEELNLPAMLKKIASCEQGLFIVTGPAGCGSSTTLAAMVDYINTHRKMHIITIEDPIEFIHKDKLSIVTQREIGTDTTGCQEALRQALRQDPDVILVGELSDPETIMTAVMAAETGHLVLATMHMPNAIQAINRLIGLFSPEQQKQLRLLLANTLKGVLAQKLLTLASESGRTPAVELLVVTPTLSNIILEGKLQDIYPHMVQGAGDGMQTFTSSITRLYEAGLITKEEALSHSEQPADFRMGMTASAESHAPLPVQQYQIPHQLEAPPPQPSPQVKDTADVDEDLNLQWL